MEGQVSVKPEQQASTNREQTRSCCFKPNVDIIESDEGLWLKADMPGSTAESISLDYRDGILTVHGAVGQRESKGSRSILKEYGIGDFHRVFDINEEVDTDGITAEYRDGVLVLFLPKTRARRPRKIEVRNS